MKTRVYVHESAEKSLLGRGRTHTCGQLRGSDVGTPSVLMGWVHTRRDLGGAVFVDLRDRYGVTQLVFRSDVDDELKSAAGALRPEDCIAVRGVVKSRGDNINKRMPTGEIEVYVDQIEVFTKAETPPFVIEDNVNASESLRLRYRYLDLRRPALQQVFILRSKVYSAARRFLENERFLEVETPFLIKNTPGGARNFLVPSRLTPQTFYALAESPQLFKQLLMVAGMDRYFQIVRCFRDEDFRGDRQPEFTQVDVELSFAREEMVYELLEGLFCQIFEATLGVELSRPFPHLTYDEALERYGSDKPDLRFGLELTPLSELAAGCGFRVFEGVAESGMLKGLRLPGTRVGAVAQGPRRPRRAGQTRRCQGRRLGKGQRGWRLARRAGQGTER
jgi:aspartyl-tRNA synthetase